MILIQFPEGNSFASRFRYSPGHSKLDPALEYIVFFIVDSVRGHIAVKYSE